MKNKVLILGITGQDGAYLAQHLLKNGYKVYGTLRRGSTYKLGRLDFLGIVDDINYIPLEITEFSNVLSILRELCAELLAFLITLKGISNELNNYCLIEDLMLKHHLSLKILI